MARGNLPAQTPQVPQESFIAFDFLYKFVQRISADLAVVEGAAPPTPVVPGGATTNVQYNNAGAFAGSANFTYNAGTNTVTFGNITGSALSMVIVPKAPTVLENAGGIYIQSRNAAKANSNGGDIDFQSGTGLGTGTAGNLSFGVGTTGVSLGIGAGGISFIGLYNSSFDATLGNLTFFAGSTPTVPPATIFVLGTDDTFTDGGLLSIQGDGGPIFEAQEAPLGTPKLAFFGATLTAKPTGVPVTAAGIHAALVALGLIS